MLMAFWCRTRGAASLLVAGLFAAACSNVAVNTELAPGANFAGRQTYAWLPNPQMGGELDASIAGQYIHADVDQALQAHGFRPSGGQPPDMLVDYRVVLRQQMDIEGGPGWGGVSTYHYTEGTLVVALTDPRTSLFLWRGVAQGIVDPGAGGSSRPENIQSAVQKMFANFPN